MSNPINPNPELSPLKQAYLALDKLQNKIKAMEAARREPLAIVGASCRLPGGANNLQAFWKLLQSGTDAISDVPADRWDVDAFYDPAPDAPGKIITRAGGFLDNIDTFDPQFFGIAPREATSMDPQQRLLLEVAWEALENAGQAPDKLVGSKTGVFVGLINNDYRQLELQHLDLTDIDPYYSSGVAQSVAAGRVSYVLGLQGPAISIDTACSSSLVAVHLACQSLRTGECDMALAGGVNLILTPEFSVAFSKYKMLAPDGRCKTFDAAADGFGRGEGCGLVVLKRLSDALANGDNIIATIVGTAINQDGASSGLTAPNGPSQESVLRSALANAGLKPTQVNYIEAHGTGTSLGDPIEVQALGAVFAQGRPADQPLALGSVKTNLGHLEGAAGITGLLKAALVLQNRTIPPHLHFCQPNPLVDWENLPLTIPTTSTPLPYNGPLYAGVSAFGFSGTNVHIVLGTAPQPETKSIAQERPLHLLKLSARSESILKQMAGQFADFLAGAEAESLPDVAFSTTTGRADLPHRLTVIAGDSPQARERLAQFAAGAASVKGVFSGPVKSIDPPKIAFLFTGQGSQYVGMGKELYQTQPTFRRALDQCAQILQPYLETPLLEVLYPAEGQSSPIDQTAYTQPALFALEYALAKLWQSWGIEPAVMMGHSVGEYVAACLAGVFSLEDGLKLIAHRGRLMQSLPAGGQMVAVFADLAQAETAVAAHQDLVSIAAVNGPQNVVISGEGEAVQQIVDNLTAQGVRCRPLTVSHAFHSPQMDSILAEFGEIAQTVTYAPPQKRLISNVTGQVVSGNAVFNAGYWQNHIRQAVQFSAGMDTLSNQKIDVFLEIGPNPVLLGIGQRCLPDYPGLWLPSLRQKRPDWQLLLDSLSQLYLYGAPVNWAGFEGDYAPARRKLRLPTTPFDRKRYWIKTVTRAHAPQVASGAGHPLLGQRLRSALQDVQFENHVTVESPSFLGDHRVHGITLMPGTAYIETGLAAAAEVFGPGNHAVTDMVIQEPLIVTPDSARVVQTVVTPTGKNATFQIFSVEANAETASAAWRLHAAGSLVQQSGPTAKPASVVLKTVQNRCTTAIDSATHYQYFKELGLDFGPSLNGVMQIFRNPAGSEALGRIELPEALHKDIKRYQIHPALLDACLQVISAVMPTTQTEVYMPVSLDTFQLYGAVGAAAWSHVTIAPNNSQTKETYTATIQLLDDDGHVLAQAGNLRLKRAAKEALQKATTANIFDWLYRVEWQAQPLTDSTTGTLADPAKIAAEVVPLLAELGRQHGLDQYQTLAPKTDSLSTAYILTACRQLGWVLEQGQTFSTEQFNQACRVLPLYHPLTQRLLEILAEDGYLAATAEGWRVSKTAPVAHDTALQTQMQTLLADYPAFDAELTLLKQCGPYLAQVLTGQTDPLELLFHGGDMSLPEKLYQDSPSSHTYNGLMQAAVKAIIERIPADRPLRVLEIGGGTGGTTAYVLPQLPAGRTQYTFTDISPAFVANARQKFSGYPFVAYQVLDIGQDLAAQDFTNRQYDLIIAANVIHATPDLRQTLQNLRHLLVPGGLLLMLEITGPIRWIDLTFGYTAGWWHFTDKDIRPTYPLLRQPAWQNVLADTGFKNISFAPGSAAGQFFDQAIIIAQAEPVTDITNQNWLVLADTTGTGQQLATLLRARGHRCALVFPGEAYRMAGPDEIYLNPTQPDHFVALQDTLKSTTWHGVVHLWSLPAQTTVTPDTTALRAEQAVATGSILHLLKTLAGLSQATPPRLWLVTRGAQVVDNRITVQAVSQAPVWGLGKVIAIEHPDLGCTRIDLDPANTESAQVLFVEVTAHTEEDQIALRQNQRYVARLTRHTPAQPQPATPDKPLRLVSTARGTLDNLTMQPVSRRQPGPGEIELRVHATGLNFRDVLNTLDMYPGDPGPLGGECAGTVTAVGKGVTGFSVGDAVMGAAGGCFSTYVTAPVNLMVPKPAHLSFEQAAAMVIPFLTAHFMLNHLGKMHAGDKVLIHAATGGVGLAAVKLAQQAGAEIFATAGSVEKRRYLKSLGVKNVMNSRTLDFAEEIKQITNGKGVDLVLNSLADEFCAQSLSVLAQNGRFLEIGKRGILTPAEVSQQRPDAAYFIVDWSQINRQDPALMRMVLLDLLNVINQHGISPLPQKVFHIDEVADAFRYMAQAKHIGKIVVTQQKAEALPANATPTEFKAEASYLITGGLGGLGLEVAQWMITKGAQHLALLGRSAPSPAAREAITQMEQLGAQITVISADVADPAQVTAALKTIETELPPLRGIIHAAGALDDGVLLHQTWQRFDTVFAAKVYGAWNMHTLTQHQPLDFFVLFSSIASLFGSPGQGNHAAANMFMDMLAHYRQAQGLPGLSLNWGAWSQTGAAVERDVGQRLAQQGMDFFSPEDGLQLLDLLMSDTTPQVGISPVNWPEFHKQHKSGSTPFFAQIAQVSPTETTITTAANTPPEQAANLQAQLQTAPASKRPSLVLAYVQEQAGRVLGLNTVDARVPLNEMGLDSLMAVELRNVLGTGTGLKRTLPATLVFDYPTVEAIAGFMLTQMDLPQAKSAVDAQPTPQPEPALSAAGTADLAGMLDSLEDLSDDEIDRLFAQQMGNGDTDNE